jgi:ABC-type sugar transport system permease subunit
MERDNPHLTSDEVQLLILSGQLSTAKVETHDMDWGSAIAFVILIIIVAVATFLLR